MNNQARSSEINIDDIVEQATVKQIDWIMARLTVDSDAKAARAVRVRPETVCRWPNKKDLDAAVHFFKKNQIPAVKAMLQNAATAAAQVMINELRGKQKLKAANDVLDRVGVARLSKIAPTTPDGEKSYQPLNLDNVTSDELEHLEQILDKASN